MKIDLDQEVMSPYGEAYTETVKTLRDKEGRVVDAVTRPLTLGKAIHDALNAQIKDETDPFDRGRLAIRALKGGRQDFTSEDVSLIKARFKAVYGETNSVLMVTLCDLVDPAFEQS